MITLKWSVNASAILTTLFQAYSSVDPAFISDEPDGGVLRLLPLLNGP